MEYKLANVNLDVDKVEDVSFPDIKDRIIEKRGHVVKFTLNEVEANDKLLEKAVVEIEAKKNLEVAKIANYESFHKFLLEMSEEDLSTCWLYKESKDRIKMCDEKLKEIKDQLQADAEEIAEIKLQIPELQNTPAVTEALSILNEKTDEAA